MHAEVLLGGVFVEQLKCAHALLEDRRLPHLVSLDLRADGLIYILSIAVHGLRELLNCYLVEDGSEPTVGDGERDAVKIERMEDDTAAKSK